MSHLRSPVLRLQFLFLVLPLWVGCEKIRQTAVNPNEFPYQVLISECDESPVCGGAIVAVGYILTSATCVLKFGGIQKFLSEGLLYGGGSSLLFVIGDIQDASIHHKYMMDPTTYDLAVIKFKPADKGPQVNATALNGTWSYPDSCVLSSWWSDPDARLPDRLTWMSLTPEQCSPYDPNMICFSDNTTVFFPNDFGSPLVCGNVLTGIVPLNGGNKAINLTAEYDWLNTTITLLAARVEEPGEMTSEETQQFFKKILQKLEVLSKDKETDAFDHLTHWNNQVVIPLSYVLFALVIFFFVLLFFLVLFTVVLVYYSRK